jgi:hypothetical protein
MRRSACKPHPHINSYYSYKFGSLVSTKNIKPNLPFPNEKMNWVLIMQKRDLIHRGLQKQRNY